MTTVADLKGKKPRTVKATVYLDDDAVAEVSEAREALADAQARHRQAQRDADREPGLEGPTVDALNDAEKALTLARERVETAESAASEVAVAVTFRSIGRRRYQELVEGHPPAKNTKDAPWNVETFPPALVAASAVAPTMSLQDAQDIFEQWNDRELLDLFNAALEANTTSGAAIVGKARG